MEVHHHSHSEGKKLRHYLFEFFMLFLAIFCGFMAENWREHLVERQREKQYAKELYNEFFADSIVIADKIKIRQEKEKDMDWLCDYFKDSSLTTLPREFYPAYTTVMYLAPMYFFEPKDGVLDQLKSSGSLRYFKNATLQNLLGDISVCIKNVRSRNDQEYQFFASPIKPFILKHYDFKWMNELRKHDENANNFDLINHYKKSDTIVKASILNLSSFDKSEAYNITSFYKQMMVGTRTLQMNDYIAINHKLLQELRQEYNLK